MATDRSSPDYRNSPDDPRSAALIVRVWDDAEHQADLRARLMAVDPGSAPTVWTTAAGDDEIHAEVRRWLRHLRGQWRSPSRGAAGTTGRVSAGHIPAPAQPLVSADWVQDHLEDPDLVVVEVDDDADRYQQGHLPGAVRMHWLDDLRHPTRRSMAEPAAFASLLDRCGIGVDTRVVFYSGMLNSLASSAYWAFRQHGHDRVSLLDGGRSAWVAHGRPVTRKATARRATGGYPTHPGRDDLVLRRGELLASFERQQLARPQVDRSRLQQDSPALTVVDCRSIPEFAGHPDGLGSEVAASGEGVTGHIPGARSLPVTDLLGPDETLLPRAALVETCRRRGLRADDRIVVYCSAANRSTLVWFVLHELLGWPDVRCYLGAWAEYGSLTDVPVERGLPEPVAATPLLA